MPNGKRYSRTLEQLQGELETINPLRLIYIRLLFYLAMIERLERIADGLETRAKEYLGWRR